MAPPSTSDCVLVVQKQRVHVNKGFLSVFSPYFDKLFNGNVRKKSHGEIKIGEDVNAADFCLLLDAIYPYRRHEVTASNVENLLLMASKFQVDVVTQRCENYLKHCSLTQVSLGKRLMLAEEYRLKNLMAIQEFCLSKCNSPAEIKEFRQTSEYAALSPKTKLLIYDSMSL